MACINSTQYASDSDYQYESENEYEYEHEYESDDQTIQIYSSINNIKIDTIDAQLHPNQYQWIIFCSKLKKVFADVCTYDYTKDHLSIQFSYDQGGFSLSVDQTTDENLWYPFVAPTITYSGKKIPLMEYLLINNNLILSKSKWNLCNDLESFIVNVDTIMRNVEYIEFSDTDEALALLVASLGITYSFETELLPSYGNLTSLSESTSGYLGNSRSTNISNKLIIHSSTKIVLNNIEAILSSDCIGVYLDIVQKILCRILYQKLSSLELTVNADFYSDIVKIVNGLGLELDISSIKDQPTEIIDTDKVIFVDSFSHSFSNESDAISKKLAKRVFAEVRNMQEVVKDFNAYIAISEQNIQRIKVLIIPDYDTPYGGGYFEFDLWVPNDYPDSPPKMKFLTTGGGKVRFNPNLYNCGKVCLSLLNTWSTNQWSASDSTISQVIISIYTMIFNEHPYTNEPAYYNALKTEAGRASSESYNKNIRAYTAKFAIAEQIKNDYSPFAEIIRTHWNTNSAKTIEAYKKHSIDIIE